jgi:hypothetical protein
MKKILLGGALASLLISCKKTEVAPTTSVKADSATVKVASATQTDDNKNLNDGVDNAMNGVKDGFSAAGARIDMTEKCGVTIDYTKYSDTKTITYTYDGSCNDNGAVKSGKIVVILVKGAKFEEKGASYTAKFEAFSTQINGKTIYLEGSLIATNVTGGNAWLTIFGWPGYTSPVIEKVKGSATAKIDTSKAATWEFARTTTVSRVDSTWKISIAGDTSVNGYTKVIDWGSNRYGESYYKEMTEPFEISSKCGGLLAFYRPSGGKCKITVERSDKAKYFIDWAWLLNSQGCSNGIGLTVSDESKNSWNLTVKY